MPAESTVVVVGRSPAKLHEATEVLTAHGFSVVGVFSEADALRTVAEHDTLLAVVTGGSVSPAARERLQAAAAPRGAVIIGANIGHSDPAAHFTSAVLPHLIAARTARAVPP